MLSSMGLTGEHHAEFNGIHDTDAEQVGCHKDSLLELIEELNNPPHPILPSFTF